MGRAAASEDPRGAARSAEREHPRKDGGGQQGRRAAGRAARWGRAVGGARPALARGLGDGFSVHPPSWRRAGGREGKEAGGAATGRSRWPLRGLRRSSYNWLKNGSAR